MSTIIPNRQLRQIQMMTANQIMNMRACEIYDGEHFIGTFVPRVISDKIVGTTVRAQAESLAERSNSVYGSEQLDYQDNVEPGEPRPLLPSEYFCEKCDKPHRKSSSIGKKHLKKQLVSV